MIIEFLLWWRARLLDVLPPRLRGDAQEGRTLIALQALSADASPAVELVGRHRGRDRLLGRFVLDAAGAAALRAEAPRRSRGVVLQLPAGVLLERQVTLPLAADRDPGRVLAYEMDRLTPFAAADLFWTWMLERRDRVAGQVRYRLLLVPRARLQPLLDTLAGAGLRPVALEDATASGARRRIALAMPDQGWLHRRGPVLAGTLCAALALAAAGLPFLAQSLALGRADEQIAALRPALHQTDALRASILDQAASREAIQASRARAGDVLAVLAALTDVLPDDTYLTEVALSRRAVSITGRSAAATRLVPALAAEPRFRDPAFAAPMTRNPGERLESFAIRAEVAP